MPTAKQKKLRAERETAKHRRLHGRKAQQSTATGGEVPEGAVLLENTGCFVRLPENSASIAEPLSTKEWSAATGMRAIETVDGVNAIVPARAKCPTCGFSQKVRKDGTMSRHDVYFGSQDTDRKQCEGTGQPWDAAASRA